MNRTTFPALLAVALISTTMALAAAAPPAASGKRFYPDDPIWRDEDDRPVRKPEPIERSDLYDLLFQSFVGVPSAHVPKASNVNTLGEVPDSSWFTNRMGRARMSLRELARGPNAYDAPDTSEPLRVVSVKTEGRSPGFTVLDGRGDTYILKFDPVENPQISTSAEVISTRFFHAFGYHVPENYLLFLHRDDFAASPEGTIEQAGRSRAITAEDIDFVLERVGRRADGSRPALLSRYLPGVPLGPFSYLGTRSDDPNDIFPHEDRRELRGMRLFAAWLEHHDSRSLNTLAMYLPEGYVRHYLIDFGSTLGATPLGRRPSRMGHEYFFEWGPTWRAAISAGLLDRPWRSIAYPDFESIGAIDAESFDPEAWKPDYPNPVFQRMQPEDAFWAAKILQRFDDASIRTIVEVGRLDDRAAEQYLIDTLIRRRERIVPHYLAQLNPLDRFEVGPRSEELRFHNLGTDAGLAKEEESTYRYEWFGFDNDDGSSWLLPDAGAVHRPRIAIPESSLPFIMVRIRTETEEGALPRWSLPVDVYLRAEDGGRSVVGIAREEGSR